MRHGVAGYFLTALALITDVFQQTPQPPNTDLTKEYVETDAIKEADGIWIQQWELVDKTFDTPEEYNAYYLQLAHLIHSKLKLIFMFQSCPNWLIILKQMVVSWLHEDFKLYKLVLFT